MNYEPGTIGNDGRHVLPDDHSRPSRRGLWIGLAIAAIVAAALLSFWVFGKKSEAAAASDNKAPAKQIPTVTVAVPGRQLVDRTISATGSIAAKVDMPIGVAGEGGRVTAVLVQPGEWVKAGQVLATIDRSVQVETQASQAAQIAVAQSDARLAQAELDRAKQLVDRGFISKADVDRRTATRDAALARVKVAQAQLEEIRARNGRLLIRAPAAGRVLTRNVEPGQIVGAGSGVLFRLAADGALELRATLSDADIAQVRVGIPVTVTPVGNSRSFVGHVWQVSPVIDPQTRQGTVRVALPFDESLRPGGFAAATLTNGASQSPLLPQSAVQSDAKGNFVYVINAKHAVVRQSIKVGQVSDAGVAITEGLSGNEQVVVSAGAFLNPGQKVIPVRQSRNAG